MQYNFCKNLFLFFSAFISGQLIGATTIDMEDISSPKSTITVRRCANIKSQKNPDSQCPMSATYGDYCSRHWKHPHRFIQASQLKREVCFTRQHTAAAARIQSFWRQTRPWIRVFHQGIGSSCRPLSRNDTELFSLDPIASIPSLYYISFVGSAGSLWSFDIRSLGQLLMRGDLKENPYTREPLSDHVYERIRKRLSWLRSRKYSVVYPQSPSTDLTSEQVWRQRVLDVFLTIEALGYHVSCDWFHDMTIDDHKEFYRTLFSLWYSRLGLTRQQRDSIVPGSESVSRKLFRFTPDAIGNYQHSVTWWEKCNLAVIEAFITRSKDKENRRLGATYVLIGLVSVSGEAADTYPWLQQEGGEEEGTN